MQNQEKEQLEKIQELEVKIDETNSETSKKLIKATEDQISIEFDSSFCSLKEEEQDEINRILGDQQIKARVYFIRHGQSIEDKGTQNIQSSEAKLTEKAKQQFKEIGEDLKKQGLTSKNTYLLYHDGDKVPMQRIIESAKIIKTSLRLEDKKVDNRVKGTDTTNKEIENQTERYVATAEEVIIFCKEMVYKLKGKENINIVCVVHKSNIGAIRQYFFKKENKPVDLGHGNMKNGEIQELDFTMEGKVVNYDVDKTILNINNYNYNSGLLEILEKEEELGDYIARFRKRELQIWELQNLVNMWFLKHTKNNTELFEKYLLSNNRELRIFCIANLLVDREFGVVEANMKELLDMEEETEIVDFVDTVLFVCTEKEKTKLLKIILSKRNVLSKIKLGKWVYWVYYNKYVRENIKYIRQKSLDERLKTGEDVIISLGFRGKNYDTMEELLQSDGTTLIEGEAGAGKSTKLLEIMEYLKPQNDGEDKYFPLYINLGEISYTRLSGEIERQTSNLYGEGKYKFIYLFDALDEAGYDDETKENLMNFINGLESKVIMTSRPNNLSVGDYKIEKLGLRILNKEQLEEYINTHLSGKQQKTWKKWKEKEFIKGIESNPLMLSIICNLLVSGEDIENVDTITKLYDKITDSRLKDWEEKKDNRETNKNKINIRKKLLSQIAYDSFVLGINIDYKYITKIIDSNDNYTLVIPYEEKMGYDLECLNMIFRKNKEGEYQFVHESFREYFLFVNYHTDKKQWFFKLNEHIKNSDNILNKIIKKINSFDKNLIIDFLKEIIELEGFKNNEEAIQNVCWAIWKLGNKKDCSSLLERIIKLEGFQNNKEAIQNVCWIILDIGDKKEGLLILENILELDGFKNNENAIRIIYRIIRKLGNKERLIIIKKIMKLDGFKNNKEPITDTCQIIGEIGYKEGLVILKEIVKLEGFQNNEEAIQNACWTILMIGNNEGIELLERIVGLDGFKNNKETISYACTAIGLIKLGEELQLLERIIELEGFKNNEEAIEKACWAIWAIGMEEWNPLEKSIKLLGFKDNKKEIIEKNCQTMKKTRIKERVKLLEKIMKLDRFKNNKIAQNYTNIALKIAKRI